ncbi:MAG: hypothetical protein IJW33_04190 [Lentisphaeria bacterium]|nr:hypothetical protein [Lentisphaeria bacterium]
MVIRKKNGFEPPVDLIDMYLDLAEKYEMEFFCGSYTGAARLPPFTGG